MSLGWALTVYILALLPVCFSYFVLVVNDMSTQLPALATMPASPSCVLQP